MLKDKLLSGFGLSLSLHLIIITIALVTVGYSVNTPPTLQVNLHPDAKPEEQIVKAGVVDKKAIDQAYQRQALAEKRRQQQLAEEKRQSKKAKEDAEKAKRDAQKLKQESVAAQQALEKAKAEKVKAEAEAQKIKAAQEKAKQELVKQQELARKQEAERKAVALKAEQEKIKAQRDTFIRNEVQRFTAEFAQSIEDNRILSSIFEGDICCKIRIQLLPDGAILSASIVESSGNPAYDEMSQAAVFKTAPFSMPEDKEVYEKLRDIVLSFRNGEQDVT